MRRDIDCRIPKGAAFVLLCVTSLLAGGCAIGPKYRVPAVQTAPAYKEAPPAAWKTAQPSDAAVRSKWWEGFEDAQLNALEEQVDAGNQSIAAAAANYDAARAVVRETRSQYLPTVTTQPGLTNSRISTVPYAAAAAGITYTEYTFPVSASWEPDVWGRVRKTVQANVSNAQASAADLENVRLLAHGALAADYFELRGVEAQ